MDRSRRERKLPTRLQDSELLQVMPVLYSSYSSDQQVYPADSAKAAPDSSTAPAAAAVNVVAVEEENDVVSLEI